MCCPLLFTAVMSIEAEARYSMLSELSIGREILRTKNLFTFISQVLEGNQRGKSRSLSSHDGEEDTLRESLLFHNINY
jgi:hypothetical protein